jgi:hypothetical protein
VGPGADATVTNPLPSPAAPLLPAIVLPAVVPPVVLLDVPFDPKSDREAPTELLRPRCAGAVQLLPAEASALSATEKDPSRDSMPVCMTSSQAGLNPIVIVDIMTAIND